MKHNSLACLMCLSWFAEFAKRTAIYICFKATIVKKRVEESGSSDSKGPAPAHAMAEATVSARHKKHTFHQSGKVCFYL